VPEQDDTWERRVRMLQAKLEEQAVDVLDETDILRSDESRRLLLDLTQQRTRFALQVSDHRIPRHWFFGLVRECVQDPEGLAALRDAVAAIARGSVAHAALTHLVECWETTYTAATAVLPWHADPEEPAMRRAEPSVSIQMVDVWDRLRAELAQIDAVDMLVAFQEATYHRDAVAPWHCSSAWHLLVHLVNRSGRPGEAEPYLVFLVGLMRRDRLSARLERLVEAWLRRLAVEQDSPAALDLLNTRSLGPGPTGHTGLDEPSPVHLVMRLETAAPGTDWYHLCWCLERYRPVRAVSGSGRLERLGRDYLEEAVSTLVRDVELALRDTSGRLILEFALPFELLDVEVEWWRKSQQYGPAKPLASDYMITLRSLERMYTTEWHRAWRARWRHVQLPAATVTYWCADEHATDLLTLEAQLQTREELTVLVLSGPPVAGSRGFIELLAGLRTGVAGIVWNRSNGDQRAAVEESLRAYVAAGTAADLPAGARRLRLAAQTATAAEQSRHLGRHLALMWDDPERFTDVPGGDGT